MNLVNAEINFSYIDNIKFIHDILMDLYRNNIYDFNSSEFRELCKSNDFSPSVIREDILNYVKFLLDSLCS